jgi:hypothetical protein
MGKNENCGKCKYDKFWHPYDLVDVESELRNQTRPASKCGAYRYNLSCPMSKQCISTNDPKVPVVMAPECCSILYQNIPKYTDVGYRMPSTNICGIEESQGFAPVKK